MAVLVASVFDVAEDCVEPVVLVEEFALDDEVWGCVELELELVEPAELGWDDVCVELGAELASVPVVAGDGLEVPSPHAESKHADVTLNKRIALVAEGLKNDWGLVKEARGDRIWSKLSPILL